MIKLNSKVKIIISVLAAVILAAFTIYKTALFKTQFNDLHFRLGYYIMALSGSLAIGIFGSLKFKFGPVVSKILGILVFIGSLFGTMAIALAFSNGDALKPYLFFMNMAFYVTGAGLALLISGSTRVSAIAGLSVSFIYNFSSFMIYALRGDSLTPTDVYSIKTAMSVAAQYEFNMRYQIISVTIMFAAMVLIAAKFPLKVKFRFRHAVMRAVGAAILAVCIMAISSINVHKYYISIFDQHYSNQQYGSAFAFYANAKKMGLAKNENFDPDKLNAILDGYTENTTIPEDKPNVIVIMNESFADLQAVSEFETNEDYMPFYRSLKENTLKGELLVSPFGGNTCNSEFEFLTGMNVGLLRANAIPYVQMIFNPIPYSMASHMNALGYTTTAFHPYYANGWNRTTIYNYMGFDKFLSIENMSEYIDKIEKIRSYTSDRCDFETVLNYLNREDKKEDERDFIFNITMQNHGGYTSKSLESEIHLENMNGDYPLAEQYLTLIKNTDDALEYFLNELESFDEPTIVLMFGDHQPNIEKSFFEELYGSELGKLSQDELSRRYHIPFMIWTNYDSEETEDIHTSPCFLSGLLMERAGLPKSRVQLYLDELQAESDIMQLNPKGYTDHEGTWHSHKDASGLDTYYDLEYAILTDEKLNYDFDYNGIKK